MATRGTQEALQFLQNGDTRQVIEVGNSIAVTLPSEAAEQGDTVLLEEIDEGYKILTPD